MIINEELEWYRDYYVEPYKSMARELLAARKVIKLSDQFERCKFTSSEFCDALNAYLAEYGPKGGDAK